MHSHDTPKQCKKCGSTDFYDCGLCRPCRRAYQKARYIEKRDDVLRYQEEYRATHKEKIKKRDAEYRRRNRDRINAHLREYHHATKEQKKEKRQAYYRANAEHIKAKVRAWELANPGRKRKYPKSKEQIRQNNQARQARRYSVKREYVDIDVVRRRDNDTCYLCGRRIESNLELDHVIPLIQGGSHTYDNIRATHRRCNRAKRGRRPDQVTHLFPRMQANPRYSKTVQLDMCLDAKPNTEKPHGW